MRISGPLLLLALTACTTDPPPRPVMPRFDSARGEECIKSQLRQYFINEGENILNIPVGDERRIVDEIIDKCGYPRRTTNEEYSVQYGRLQATLIRAEVAQPYRDRLNEQVRQENLVRERQREQSLSEAMTRYLTCVIQSLDSLARTSQETASVIVEAATGSCPAEAAALSQIDWRMIETVNLRGRSRMMARVLRIRSEQP